MSDSPPRLTLPGTPKLLPALPIIPSGTRVPLPVPLSTFSTYQSFEPRCGHITMSRVYHVGFRCERCNSHGSFGWLYRCTEHRELIIDDLNKRGYTVAFDEIGAHFSQQMTLGKWGPDKRQHKHSVLNEMTQAQMQTYTPSQLATLLAQRENVWKTAEQDLRSPGGSRIISKSMSMFNPLPLGRSLFDMTPDSIPRERPWVPTMQQECQFKACHNCYRGAAEKAWLSMDSIVNGDIPPTAASAYAFHYMQQRPICDAEVVGNLGYRAVPLPRQHQPMEPRNCFSSPPIQGHTIAQVLAQNQTADDSDQTASTTDNNSWHSAPSIHHENNVSSGDLGIETEHIEDIAMHQAAVRRHPNFTTPNLHRVMGDVASLSCWIPLPGPTVEEELFLAGEPLEDLCGGAGPEEEEGQVEEGGHFGSGPVHVPGGLAVTEEAVQTGVADIVTQV